MHQNPFHIRNRLPTKVVQFVEDMPTLRLVGILGVSGFVLPFVLSVLGIRDTNHPVAFLVISLSFFLLGCSGLVMILRREAPIYFFMLRGWPAVIIGLGVLVVFWSAAFVPYGGLIWDWLMQYWRPPKISP